MILIKRITRLRQMYHHGALSLQYGSPGRITDNGWMWGACEPSGGGENPLWPNQVVEEVVCHLDSLLTKTLKKWILGFCDINK